MGAGERETWTTDEFGRSHQGAVGVLQEDGTVPGPVYFDAGSGAGGSTVSQWNVYDGRSPRVPRAAALRAVCSCGWTGPEHRLDWESIAGKALAEAGAGEADACLRDWDGHTSQVEASAIPLPEAVTTLLARLEEEIDKLTKTSPAAAVRAARRLEVTAERVGYWAAHGYPDGPYARAGGRGVRAGRAGGAPPAGPLRPLGLLPVTDSGKAHVVPHLVLTERARSTAERGLREGPSRVPARHRAPPASRSGSTPTGPPTSPPPGRPSAPRSASTAGPSPCTARPPSPRPASTAQTSGPPPP